MALRYVHASRLCDLRLFLPVLSVIEPVGNKEEKILNYDIGMRFVNLIFTLPFNNTVAKYCLDPHVVYLNRSISYLYIIDLPAYRATCYANLYVPWCFLGVSNRCWDWHASQRLQRIARSRSAAHATKPRIRRPRRVARQASHGRKKNHLLYFQVMYWVIIVSVWSDERTGFSVKRCTTTLQTYTLLPSLLLTSPHEVWPSQMSTSAPGQTWRSRLTRLSFADLLICIWVVNVSKEKQKYTVKVNAFSSPEEVIAEAIRYRQVHYSTLQRWSCKYRGNTSFRFVCRTIKQNMSPEQQQQCIEDYKSSYVLKICGVSQYLLQNAPMIQYKVFQSRRG